MKDDPAQPGEKMSRVQRTGWWLGLLLAAALFVPNTLASFDIARRHLPGADAFGITFLLLPSVELGFVGGGALVALIARQPGLALRWSFQSLAYLVAFDLLLLFVYGYACCIV